MFNSVYTLEAFILNIFIGLVMLGLMFYALFKRRNEAAFGWIYATMISVTGFVLTYARTKYGMNEDYYQFIFILLHCNLGLAIFFASLYMVENHTRHEYTLIFFIFNLIVSTWGYISVTGVESLFWRLFPAAIVLSGLEVLSAAVMLISYNFKLKPAGVKAGILLLCAGLIIDGIASFGLLLTLNGMQGPLLALGLAGRLLLSGGLLVALYGE